MLPRRSQDGNVETNIELVQISSPIVHGIVIGLSRTLLGFL